MFKMFINFRILIFFAFILFAAISCDSVNSQEEGGSNSVRPKASLEKKEVSPPSDDNYELSKAGAEELNKQPLPDPDPKILNKPFSRKQIRTALIANKLIGESSTKKIGGYKIVHFSHVCNLAVENKPFHVVRVDSILQLASFARADSRTLIFDENARLIQNLSASDPLFCDGNRLLFNDYTMTISYGEPGEQIKGNVLIFSNNALDIKGKMANLNFYKIKNLIY